MPAVKYSKEEHAVAVPTTDEVTAAVRSALAASLKCPAEGIDSYLKEGGEVDSYNGLEVVLALQERFGVDIEERELTSWVCRSPVRIARLVQRRMRKRGTGGTANGR